MSVHSMTGFARTEGGSEAVTWFWELRSVNGKGFDMRLRLPPGLDALDAKLRAIASKAVSRGTIHASLTLSRQQSALEVRLNEDVLKQVHAAAHRAVELVGGTMPDTSELLGLRGVLEIAEADAQAVIEGPAANAVISDFEKALGELVAARAGEGSRLLTVISEQVDEIERLTGVAEAAPARRREAIQARLGEQVRRLLEADQSMDPNRLYQEAVILATRADVEEELKRLHSHISAARELLQAGGGIGRKLDFMAQEFQREANTLCSKSIDSVTTEAGLALKVKIDQLREQVQNLE